MGDKCSESVHSFRSETAATNRFADYFVICGLDLNEGLEPDRFAGKMNVCCNQIWFYSPLIIETKEIIPLNAIFFSVPLRKTLLE